MTERFIYVNRWPEFQHYKGQDRPKWIKDYTRLLYKDEYLRLSLRLRGLLHGIWIAYAMSGRELGASPAKLGRILGDDTVRTRDLASLTQAGFIRICSRPTLAKLYAREEVEKEKPEASNKARPQGNGQGVGFTIDRDLLRDIPR